MNSLYFGASLAPRIKQAASQIQDSRDLSRGSGTVSVSSCWGGRVQTGQPFPDYCMISFSMQLVQKNTSFPLRKHQILEGEMMT